MASEGKRKLWSEESMLAATSSVVQDNMSLREASRLYNVPFETLRRRVNGSVKQGCKPGPGTALSEEEEERLASYLIQMSEMGFGLSRDRVMHLAVLSRKPNESIHSKMKKQVERGLMASVDVIQNLPFVRHNLCHTAGHCLQLQTL